jgi:23S rRNA (uracil1939-C5)-methyltransferase
MKPALGDLVALTIDNLAFGGAGVGRVDNLAVFVPLTIPGERVTARIVEVKDSWLEAQLVEVLEPSPHRVTPPCPYFGDCGGCQWQHIAYDEQIENKKRIALDAFAHIGKIPPPQEIVVDPSTKQLRYRIRAEFNGSKRPGALRMGFCQVHSRRVVDVADCLLVPEPVSAAYAAFRDYLVKKDRAWSPYRADFSWSPGDGRVHLHYLAPQKAVEAIDEAPELFPAIPGLGSLGVRLMRSRPRRHRLLGDNHLSYPIPKGTGGIPRDLTLRITEGTFFQVNYEMNLRLIERVIEMAALTGTETVLDIYSGAGNFTLPLAPFAKRVIGVEDNPIAVKDGIANARAMNMPNCQFLRRKAEEVVGEFISAGMRPEVVIIDPPRPGAKPIIPALIKLAPARIIYVSCNPTTLARDVAELTAGGYTAQKMAVVDLFPQTYHLESVTLLTR